MSGFRESVQLYTATIANGQTVSGAVDLGVSQLCGIDIPDAFTGNAISFQVSNDGSDYDDFYDADTNAAISMPITAGKSYAVDPVVFLGYRYVKVVSNAAEGGSRAVGVSGRIAV